MSEVLVDADQELLRQVHPEQCPGGTPARTAFTPTKKHQYLLSTLRGEVGGQEAHRRHVEESKLESAGTWALTVAEVTDAGCVAVDDAAESGTDDHVSVDFNVVGGRSAKERAGRKLREAAVIRGPRFVPSP